jgi:hypothetical protein
MILILLLYKAFPNREDAILQNLKDLSTVKVESSGSGGYYKDGKCEKTYPNATINSDRYDDWCSLISKNNGKPFISYSVEASKMKLTGYSVRSGCCYYYYSYCTSDDEVYDYYCCCRLYSFSLLGSNDNVTWKVLHKVENDNSFYDCQYKTYQLSNDEYYKYIKFVQDDKFPGSEYCMCLNQMEFYGSISKNGDVNMEEGIKIEDDSISIIGKVKKGY